ncbi:hypothetical protein ACFQ05_17705 [Amycolatopsis umgeniensis]|uniref:Lipoprotein n=1 Tax=Amycolatopsis umgeniensis TaxID=336628 RepID=A0A841B8E5_9PSEU|nr:hypothetical protein [Amycolatopsis umgeniensis]MBB5855150.1 hypothetical protein [Amycolatopsis umgeniensis]
MTMRGVLAVIVCVLVAAGCEAHSIAPPVVTPAPAVSATVSASGSFPAAKVRSPGRPEGCCGTASPSKPTLPV